MKGKLLIGMLLALGTVFPGLAGAEENGCLPRRGCPCCCPPPMPPRDRQMPPQGPPPSFLNDELIEALALTDGQVERIKTLESSFREQMDAMRKDEEKRKKEEDKDRKTKMDEMMMTQKEKLKSILSDDQYKSFEEYMRNHRPGGPRDEAFAPKPRD